MLQPKEEAVRGEKTTLAAVCNALARETTELGRAHSQIMSTISGPKWREGERARSEGAVSGIGYGRNGRGAGGVQQEECFFCCEVM
jgi:hypothetical protein